MLRLGNTYMICSPLFKILKLEKKFPLFIILGLLLIVIYLLNHTNNSGRLEVGDNPIDLQKNEKQVEIQINAGKENNIVYFGLPITPTNLNTPEKLLTSTNNVCTVIGTYDPKLERRVEYNIEDWGDKTLKTLEGGKAYGIRCKKDVKLRVKGVPVEKINIISGQNPNWISAKLEDNGKNLKQFITSLNSTSLNCIKIRILGTNEFFDYGNEKIETIKIKPTEGYELFCH